MLKKILIIDDDIEIRKQIKCNLQNETTEVYYAELIQTIRKRSVLPVLVLSSDSSIHRKKKAFASGADDFLVKPFVTEECLYRIKFSDRAEVEQAVDEYIQFYNFERIDLKNGLTPFEIRSKAA